MVKQMSLQTAKHGCIKQLTDRVYFEKGLAEMVKQLQPHTIIVYGAAPDRILGKYKEDGIRIIRFDSEYAVSH